MLMARKKGLLLVAVALLVWTSSCSSASKSSRLRRGVFIAVPDTVHVTHFKQELGDVIGRLALFGMSRTGHCTVYYGGRLKVISDRPGPGGEVKVSYYPTAVPAGYRDHCPERTVIEMQESDLRFYAAFFELEEAVLAHLRSRVDAAMAAGGPVSAGAAVTSTRDIARYPGGFVRVANAQPLSRGDTLLVRTGDYCRVCASQPNPGDAPISIRKGSLSYFDLVTGEERSATVLEYRDASEGQRCGNRECPTATVFLEPDLLAAVMKVVHGLFVAEDLNGMQIFAEQVKADLYPTTTDPRPLGGDYEIID